VAYGDLFVGVPARWSRARRGRSDADTQ